jgi:hypothetical protein
MAAIRLLSVTDQRDQPKHQYLRFSYAQPAHGDHRLISGDDDVRSLGFSRHRTAPATTAAKKKK